MENEKLCEVLLGRRLTIEHLDLHSFLKPHKNGTKRFYEYNYTKVQRNREIAIATIGAKTIS